jgi:hypothetical protein
VTRIITLNGLLAERRERGDEIEVAELQRPIGEMITTSDGLMDLVQKVRVDVAFGQAEVPILYEPIYRRIPGPFPGKTVDIGENTLQANVVFFEKLEGGEVQFGTLAKGQPATATLRTWAAGFEWTEDMEEWDSTWQFELVNQAFSSSTTRISLPFSPTHTRRRIRPRRMRRRERASRSALCARSRRRTRRPSVRTRSGRGV